MNLTIRYADSLDEDALTALAALDSSALLKLPVLVADVEGELRAALSLADGELIADPFHPAVELIELLCTRARQLADAPRPRLLLRLRLRLRAPLRVARTIRLELRD